MAYETTDQLIAQLADHWNKRDDTVLYKLLDVYNQELEKVSDEAQKVEKWRSLKEAKGTTLDLLGQDRKAYRISDDDDTYRFIIFVHILMSRAQGTIPSMVHIMSTALNAEPENFKVYKTGLRHVGMKIPWDYVKTLQMQKFIIKNLQNMLAMGYWIDEIVFVTTTKLPLYVGMGTQLKHRKIERSPVKWWTGWKARTSDKQYIGVATQIKHRNTLSSNTKWWTGWKAESTRSQFIGVVGQLAKSSVWATAAVWSKPQTAEIHAGLTIGNKTLTTTTQSIKTE